MKQTHSEETVQTTDSRQDTGNHKNPGAPDAKAQTAPAPAPRMSRTASRKADRGP